MHHITLRQPFLLASVILMLLTTGCSSKPTAPIVTFEGYTTNSGILEIEWPELEHSTVLFTGKEIEAVLKLPEGFLRMRGKMLSVRTGLPILEWTCFCEEIDETHWIEISVERVETHMVIQLLDTVSGKVLLRKIPANDSMGTATPIPKAVFSVANNMLNLPNNRLDLAHVLHDGMWRVDPSIVWQGYDGVLVWECTIPRIVKSGPQPPDYCYCHFSQENDDPTCSSYRRLAYAAFRTTSSKEVEVLVFDANFAPPNGTTLLPKSDSVRGEPQRYALETK